MIRQDDYSRKVATASNKLLAIRRDPTKTEARYDEIIELRMFILDLEATERHKDPEQQNKRLLEKIDKMSVKWGQKGDCV